jgi:hypothetical protein
MTVKTYALAIESKHDLRTLKLPLMTKEQAFEARSYLQGISGKTIHVVNVAAP